MILEGIIFVFIYVIFGLIRIVLLPIDAIVTAVMPTLESQLTTVSTYFSTISSSLSYAFSWTMLPQSVLVAVIGYWTFVYSSYLAVYIFKKLPKWINYLKIW